MVGLESITRHTHTFKYPVDLNIHFGFWDFQVWIKMKNSTQGRVENIGHCYFMVWKDPVQLACFPQLTHKHSCVVNIVSPSSTPVVQLPAVLWDAAQSVLQGEEDPPPHHSGRGELLKCWCRWLNSSCTRSPAKFLALFHCHLSDPAGGQWAAEQRSGWAERESGGSGSQSGPAVLLHHSRQGDQVRLQLKPASHYNMGFISQ